MNTTSATEVLTYIHFGRELFASQLGGTIEYSFPPTYAIGLVEADLIWEIILTSWSGMLQNVDVSTHGRCGINHTVLQTGAHLAV